MTMNFCAIEKSNATMREENEWVEIKRTWGASVAGFLGFAVDGRDVVCVGIDAVGTTLTVDV